MGIWCNSCSSLGIYTLKVKNSNEQTFVFVTIRKTRSEIIRTNLFQNIDKIVKGFTKSSPLNRPAEIWCIKYRAPEMWLAWILNRLESITAIPIKRNTIHLTVYFWNLSKSYWDKCATSFQNPVNTFQRGHDLGYSFRLWIPWVTTVHEQYILPNQESHLTHKLQTLDHLGTIVISLKHQVKIPSQIKGKSFNLP